MDKDILESAHRQRQEAKNHLNNLCDMMEVSHRAKAFIALDNGLLDAYKRLSSTPEVVGQVQKNTLLRNTIASLTITEQRLAFSSKKYNRDVMQYNKLLQPLPNHFIVFIFQYMKLGFMQNPKPLARLPIDSSGM